MGKGSGCSATATILPSCSSASCVAPCSKVGLTIVVGLTVKNVFVVLWESDWVCTRHSVILPPSVDLQSVILCACMWFSFVGLAFSGVDYSRYKDSDLVYDIANMKQETIVNRGKLRRSVVTQHHDY